jgi:hypothetical protein
MLVLLSLLCLQILPNLPLSLQIPLRDKLFMAHDMLISLGGLEMVRLLGVLRHSSSRRRRARSGARRDS